MQTQFKNDFLEKWKRYFGSAELPVAFYYANNVSGEELSDSKDEERCLIGNLNRVRNGYTFVYSKKSPGCPGGKRFSGFIQSLHPNFEFFLSCGMPGKIEGERYKKTPDLVKEFVKDNPPFAAPAKFLIFKRWDKVLPENDPLEVIFFAGADVLSGLFTLANYDTVGLYGVITPMGSGCSSIINYPYREYLSEKPRCILGMFDITARPDISETKLTFTIPMKRFKEMVNNMDESFLTTESWEKVKHRINK